MCIVPAGYLHVSKLLLGMRANRLQFRHAIDDVDRQRVAIYFVVDCQFHRRVDVAAFPVTANVKVPVISSVVSEPVNQPRIAVKVEDDGFVDREQTIEVAIAQTMRVRLLPVCLHS